MGGQTSRWLVSSAVFALTIVFVVSGLPAQTAGFTTSNSLFSFSESTAASLGLLVGTASQQAGIISERLPALPDGYFVENRGQVKNEQVRFYVRSSDMQVGLARGRILYDVFERPLFPIVDTRRSSENLSPRIPLRGVHIQLSFEGGNPVDPEGRSELPFRTHYLVGAEPRDWVTDLRGYGEVKYENLYDGIDLVYRTSAQGVKYEFLVHPRADPSKISISVEGGLGLRMVNGALVLSTSIGDLVDSAPIAYEVTGASVKCGFAVRGVASYGFECETWDPSQSLIIDPLVYSTFVGGSTYEVGYGLAVDASGNAYVTGITSSPDFPVTPGAFDTSYSGIDAFVAKLNPTGTALAYATFLGGSSAEQGLAIAVDLAGNVYVAGMTWSTDFPTTPGAPDSSFNGGVDGFVAKLDATGATLMSGTYLGGSGEDDPFALAVDASGSVVVAGRTDSGNFPATPGAFDTSFNGWTDGFVARLNAAGTLFTYVTFLGGWSIDYVAGVAIDSGGQAVVAGRTDSFDFPATAGAYDPSYNDNGDAFITKLTATGSALGFSTFLGGTGQDEAWGFTIDSSGALYVCGDTVSNDFPATPGSFDTTFAGGGDAFVAKVTGTGASLVYATYLGGASEDRANTVAVDGSGNAFVVGETTSADFPTTPGAFDSSYGGSAGLFDGFVTEIDSNGARLTYGTYFGGDGQDLARAAGLDSMGSVIIAGYSESGDFPVTPGAFDMIQRTGKAYVAKLGPVSSVAAPVLAWTGEPNYVADGVDPQIGGTTTTFTFRVAYSDSDNDPPVPIRVEVEKPVGSSWGTFRLSLDGWVGAPFDYSAGARFAFSTTLSPVGLDYYYAFNATDGRAWGGGAPTMPSSGPIVDDPPTALANASRTTAFLSDPIVFDGSGSTDDFGVVAYLWTFGDGQTDSNAVVTHTFSSRTMFLVVLSVWDGRGQIDNDSLQVEVQNRAPVADAGLDQSSYKYTLVTLDGTRSSDADGDTLTFQWVQTAGPPVTIASHRWRREAISSV